MKKETKELKFYLATRDISSARAAGYSLSSAGTRQKN